MSVPNYMGSSMSLGEIGGAHGGMKPSTNTLVGLPVPGRELGDVEVEQQPQPPSVRVQQDQLPRRRGCATARRRVQCTGGVEVVRPVGSRGQLRSSSGGGSGRLAITLRLARCLGP